MKAAYPEGMSPKALKNGRWVKDHMGISRWRPNSSDVEERKVIAHFLDHSRQDCARCQRGVALSRRSEHTRSVDGIVSGRVIELRSTRGEDT